VLRYVLGALAAGGGIACVVVGVELASANPPLHGKEEHSLGALGYAYGVQLGWALIVLGGLMLCGSALALVFGRRARDAEPAAQADRSPPPLPEARAHFRSPDEGNGK